MSRFFVPKESIKESTVTISGKEAHHILDVMRLKRLDKVTVFDGTGNEYKGFVEDVKNRSLIIKINETIKSPSRPGKVNITLLQALPKKDKMDYIVEKSTELGAGSIVPVVTSRTIPSWDPAKKEAHVQRWRKIAIEAAKQCGRADIPDITAVKDFDTVVKEFAGYGLKLIAALADDAIVLKEVLRKFNASSAENVVIAIGPEGDFTPDEIKLAKESGFKLVDLGERVLKSDTAGLAVLAIINYELSATN